MREPLTLYKNYYKNVSILFSIYQIINYFTDVLPHLSTHRYWYFLKYNFWIKKRKKCLFSPVTNPERNPNRTYSQKQEKGIRGLSIFATLLRIRGHLLRNRTLSRAACKFPQLLPE